MNPEQWLSLKWNGGSTMSDRWLNQSKIIQGTGTILSKYLRNSEGSYSKLQYWSISFYISKNDQGTSDKDR